MDDDDFEINENLFEKVDELMFADGEDALDIEDLGDLPDLPGEGETGQKEEGGLQPALRPAMEVEKIEVKAVSGMDIEPL